MTFSVSTQGIIFFTFGLDSILGARRQRRGLSCWAYTSGWLKLQLLLFLPCDLMKSPGIFLSLCFNRCNTEMRYCSDSIMNAPPLGDSWMGFANHHSALVLASHYHWGKSCSDGISLGPKLTQLTVARLGPTSWALIEFSFCWYLPLLLTNVLLMWFVSKAQFPMQTREWCWTESQLYVDHSSA